jgi:allantoicase
VLPRTKLAGDSENKFVINAPFRVTHLRFHIYPDGGVARLRVHGEAVAEPRALGRGEVDLASVENGGRVIACNDMFFGSRHNLIMPGRGVNMGDGWETKRSRREGPDWVIVALGAAGTVNRIEVDTAHFKGNAPESCALELCEAPEASTEEVTSSGVAWREVLPRTKLLAHTRHFFEEEVTQRRGTHARFRIWPDGGVSRLRLFGSVDQDTRRTLGVRRFDLLFPEQAERELLTCCGSRAWAKKVVDARPLGTFARLVETANAMWSALPPDDWHEAFRAHPRIGEKKAAVDSGAQFKRWSEQEQAGVSAAERTTLDELARVNRSYEERFGHIYIVCASGKSADELLSLAKERLANTPDRELRVAAEEQRKITELRLARLAEQTR